MNNDLRLRIHEYFELEEPDREQLLEELTEFYFNNNVSTRTEDEFEKSIGQLLFNFHLEHGFAVKSESYNRAEIYKKLFSIFFKIREDINYENGWDNGRL